MLCASHFCGKPTAAYWVAVRCSIPLHKADVADCKRSIRMPLSELRVESLGPERSRLR